MSIIKNLIGIKEIKGTMFYKEFSEDSIQLNELAELSKKVQSNKKKLIDRDIVFLKAGISGEKNVYYELKNSFIPMICLHDIRIEEGDYVAQLDFVVITHNYIMILETKKLNGDIYINESGDFVRSIKNNYGKVIKKEGIYSPVAQNERHIRILKEVLIKNKKTINTPVLSGVVIANPKSIVNKTKAPKSIMNDIFRYDQLTEVLNTRLKSYKNGSEMFEHKMKDVAEFLISNNKNISINYNGKYSLSDEDFIGNKEASKVETNNLKVEVLEKEVKKLKEIVNEIKKEVNDNSDEKTDEQLLNKLKEYRTNMSKEESRQAYLIYNNETLEDIIKIKPKNKEELMMVKGFGPKKTEKYGDSIIDIIATLYR